MVSGDIIARWLTYSQSSTRQQMMKGLFFFSSASCSPVSSSFFPPSSTLRPTRRPGLKHPSRHFQTKQKKEDEKKRKENKGMRANASLLNRYQICHPSAPAPPPVASRPSPLVCVSMVCVFVWSRTWVDVALSACGRRLSPWEQCICSEAAGGISRWTSEEQ